MQRERRSTTNSRRRLRLWKENKPSSSTTILCSIFKPPPHSVRVFNLDTFQLKGTYTLARLHDCSTRNPSDEFSRAPEPPHNSKEGCTREDQQKTKETYSMDFSPLGSCCSIATIRYYYPFPVPVPGLLLGLVDVVYIPSSIHIFLPVPPPLSPPCFILSLPFHHHSPAAADQSPFPSILCSTLG